MNVAIIPARGGSKRIPGKNIKPFSGRPIIAYSIQTAIESGLFERIIVSTDSEEIASAAVEYGAETPFTRPPELADDFATTASVLTHALEWLKDNGGAPQFACCIYATAPFLRSEFLQQGFDLLIRKKASSAFSVTTYPCSIYRALRLKQNGSLAMIWPQFELARSNDLPQAFHDAGQFYWVCCKKFLETKRLYADDAQPVILPRYLVQDIDTQEDWETAELLFSALTLRKDENKPHGGI